MRATSPALRRLRGAAAAGALAVAAIVVGTPSTEASAGGCTAPRVAVVVDFSHFGGSRDRGCVPWSSSLTGVSALQGAGFTVTGTARYGTAFVCRLDGQPTAATEPCQNTPSAKAYWSYWHADAGQTRWTYSQQGVSSSYPKAGSVDAWTFGATDTSGTTGQPGFPPSAVLPTAPTPASRGPAPSSRAPAPSSRGSASPAPKPPAPKPRAPTSRAPTSASRAPAPTRAGSASPSSRPPRPSAPSGASASTPSLPPSPTATGAPGKTPSATPQRTAARRSRPSTSHPPTRSSSRPSSSSPAGARPSASPTTSPSFVDVSPRAQATPASTAGSPWPTVAGVGILGAIAAAVGAVALRRHQARR